MLFPSKEENKYKKTIAQLDEMIGKLYIMNLALRKEADKLQNEIVIARAENIVRGCERGER